jgi:hypothetical protein
MLAPLTRHDDPERRISAKLTLIGLTKNPCCTSEMRRARIFSHLPEGVHNLLVAVHFHGMLWPPSAFVRGPHRALYLNFLAVSLSSLGQAMLITFSVRAHKGLNLREGFKFRLWKNRLDIIKSAQLA